MNALPHVAGNHETRCRQIQAVTAFGFLNWIARKSFGSYAFLLCLIIILFLVFFYNITLLVLIIRQHMRGNSTVWNGYITETDFAATGPNSAVPSNKAGFALQYQAPAVVPVYPTQQYQAVPPYPQV
jgi:L-asparagine transporter-like permease